MNIIYMSSCCSNEKFNKLQEEKKTKKLPQAQKYHSLLIEGLVQKLDGNLFALSAIPVNHRWTNQIFFPREEEKRRNIYYVYDSFINLFLLRQITRIITTKKEIRNIINSNQDCIIVCDILNQALASAARKCGKKYDIPVIGIVTDVPGHTSGARDEVYNFIRKRIVSLAEKNAKRNLSKYDAYLLLTRDMNQIVNKNDKPFIVLEGHSDIKMREISNVIEEKTYPKVALYAGGIYEKYGIGRLVNAFIRGKFADWELHIYGDGDYRSTLCELIKRHSNIKYFGIQSNSLIVGKQIEASLLLNPRLTNEEYVKYSFPSKIMECMASGTPLCTTKFSGLPEEYNKYLYFFEEESEEGFLTTLEKILNKDSIDLHLFGIEAKKFVLSEKSNLKQAEKLIDFLKSM